MICPEQNNQFDQISGIESVLNLKSSKKESKTPRTNQSLWENFILLTSESQQNLCFCCKTIQPEVLDWHAQFERESGLSSLVLVGSFREPDWFDSLSHPRFLFRFCLVQPSMHKRSCSRKSLKKERFQENFFFTFFRRLFL